MTQKGQGAVLCLGYLRHRTAPCIPSMSNGIFSYDSKLTNILGFIGDLFITNIVYLLCCIPLFTIGAAQAGLHTAMRILQNPLDDRSVLKAYFRGFKSGFTKITLVHTVFLILDGILIFTIWVSYTNAELGIFVPLWFPVVVLCFCAVIHALLPAFHAQFNCKPFHLFRNCVLLLISHPLRSIAVGVLTWAPLVLYFWNGSIFASASVVFLTVYYSIAFLFNVAMLQKPFKLLMEDDNPDEEFDEVK